MAKKVINRRALSRIKKELPEYISTTAVNWFTQSFRKQGFTDAGLKRWQKRSRRNRDTGRAILVKTGDLKRSIRKKRVTFRRMSIQSSLPYAEIHNEGGTVKGTFKVKEHTRKIRGKQRTIKAHNRTVNFEMPKRQFMGESEKLNRKTIKLIYKTIDKALGF